VGRYQLLTPSFSLLSSSIYCTTSTELAYHSYASLPGKNDTRVLCGSLGGYGYEIKITVAICTIPLPAIIKLWRSKSFCAPCPSLAELCMESLLMHHDHQRFISTREVASQAPRSTLHHHHQSAQDWRLFSLLCLLLCLLRIWR